MLHAVVPGLDASHQFEYPDKTCEAEKLVIAHACFFCEAEEDAHAQSDPAMFSAA